MNDKNEHEWGTFHNSTCTPREKKHVNILKQQLHNLYDPYVTQTSHLF